MEEIEIKKKCQGTMHRISIRMENGEIKISCPDHDFELDEIKEAMEGPSTTKSFCLGVYTGWTGIRDVTLAQVAARINGARSHGLTSKTAREIFGTQTANLLYLGVRSPNFAQKLLASLVWPTGVPFDPAAAERFVNAQPKSAKSNFAVAATAGGMGFDQSDIDWLDQEGIDLRFAVENLYEPPMWHLMRQGKTRDDVNKWWRTSRVLVPRGNGRLVINLVSTLPSPLTDLDLVPMDGLEMLTTIRRTHGLAVAYRMITGFNIHDAPTLAAIIDAKWTIQELTGLSITEVQRKAQTLLHRQQLKI